MKFKKYIILALTIFLVMKIDAQVFGAGTSLRVITPKKLIPISGGTGSAIIPTSIKGDLFVRAFVMEKGDTKIAIVSVDNLGWPSDLGDRSRELIKGIAPENIIIGATHTHSGPDAYGFPDENGNTAADIDYLNWCVIQIADAVNEAVENLEEASLKTAVAEAKGKIAYNYYAEKLYDPRCGVIQAISTSGKNKGKPIVTLVNYATHPEVLGSARKIISPDLCGPLYDRIESKVGGMAMFMNGAQGGMVTADNRLGNGEEARDWKECVRIGNLMADEALRIIEPAIVQNNPDIYCASKEIKFVVESEAMRYVLNNSPIVDKSKNNDDFTTVTAKINLINIGKAQVLTIPGEALPNIGFYLKRKMKTDQPFLFGLTNDAYGYMLTKEDFNSFERYNYISSTSLGEMTGDKYVEEALDIINKSPESQK